MTNRRWAAITAALLLLLPFSPADAAKTLKIRTTFVTTRWTIDCPKGPLVDLGKAVMTDKGWQLLTECMGAIEAANGLKIKSKTKVKNFVVVKDRIDSETEISIADAEKLKKIIEDNPILSPPWREPRRRLLKGPCPPITRIGEFARQAFATPVTPSVTPGPAVIAATPIEPGLQRAHESAA